jgi:hypothetical protein
MTDDTIREQVATVIDREMQGWNKGQVLSATDAALAVATPLIRAKVIEELAQEADETVIESHIGQVDGWWTLPDWLRFHLPRTLDRPDEQGQVVGG